MVDPISVISLADLCLRYGKKLVERYSAYAHANDELHERKVRVENYWMRTRYQLKLLQQVEGTLEEEHRNTQQETLQILLNKLQIAGQILDNVLIDADTKLGKDDIRMRKLKYSFKQQKIDKAIQDLESWHNVFDPSWYLIYRIPSKAIDTTLQSYSVDSTQITHTPIVSAQSLRKALQSNESSKPFAFLHEEGLESLQLRDIPLSTARIGQSGRSGKSPYIIERYEVHPEGNLRHLERDCRDLAKRLSFSNPQEFGLLNCKGVVKHKDKNANNSTFEALTFIFRVPAGCSQPRSLRECLKNIVRTDSLSDRLGIAQDIVKAVNYVHAFGFVHKNIRPETIILFNNESSGPPGIGSAFLIGFADFRAAEGNTLKKGSSSWQKRLYQHPTRMGSNPEAYYIMQHDIYSLGCCLLEIGLWESLVDYEDEKALLPQTSEEAGAISGYSLDDSVQPSSFKDHLLSLAQGELKRRMGTIYSEVVVTCLTCLDPENADFGNEDEFQDEDGILVGVRYIQKVIMRLNGISI
ncbi:unnamed protein product [Penicillium salamii]|nr:unnamed protein product [Penicillium salamii]